MAEEITVISKQHLENIADALRSKYDDEEAVYYPRQMASAIRNIPSGGGGEVEPSVSAEVQRLKTYNVSVLVEDEDIEPSIKVEVA